MIRSLAIFYFLLLNLCQAIAVKDLEYGKHEKQKLDLYLPDKKSDSIPLIIFIHGGAWRIGDKTQAFIETKKNYFLNKGWALASINYRLSPEAQHPEHVSDICRAIAWIQKNGETYGLNTNKIILAGHSAGAHLAALATIDQERLKNAGGNPKSIIGALLLDGAAYDIPKQIESSGRFLKKPYLEAFTTKELLQKDASPIFKVKAGSSYPPFLILACADRDTSLEQSSALAKAINLTGGKAKVVSVNNKSHRTINKDFGIMNDPTTKAFEAFFKF